MGTWQNRIKNHLEDKDTLDLTGKDAQTAHAQIAIATSNVVGKMPGNSVERDFLPQAYSDFIYAIIIEEMGIEGGVFVLMLYMFLLIRAGRIASHSERNFPAFLIMGLALMLVCQAILNMMVAVGLFPVTGQNLPLISRGGSSMLINCCYIGMMLSISRYVNKKQEIKMGIDNPEDEKSMTNM
jgi:cell division protein FtsW